MHETITHAAVNIPEIYDNLGLVKVAFFFYFLFIVLTVTTLERNLLERKFYYHTILICLENYQLPSLFIIVH